jgi:uncharacterized tellurite resistance protein B-like protein
MRLASSAQHHPEIDKPKRRRTVSILQFLGLDNKNMSHTMARRETATVRKIAEALDRLEPARAKYIAAFAFILSRVANADSHISLAETRTMERIVVQWGNLPEEQAIIVVQIAKTQSRLFGSTENYLVTREFNGIATTEQRMDLLHCLFAVSAADDSISSVEDTEVRKIASELGLEHKDFISIRSSYREKLAVLKNLPR